jgi:7-keto-8-aminopelargonate synthetase-like enzyme
VLASDGTIFVDSRAHKTIWDGCVAARAHGATVVRYAHDDPAALERLLHRHPKAPRLVCMDGINSMTGNPPDLPAFLALARTNDALLYVDDAHGFGVVGERDRRRSASTAAAATGSSATWARATTTWCSPAASQRPTPPCSPSSPARPSSSACSR